MEIRVAGEYSYSPPLTFMTGSRSRLDAVELAFTAHDKEDARTHFETFLQASGLPEKTQSKIDREREQARLSGSSISARPIEGIHTRESKEEENE